MILNISLVGQGVVNILLPFFQRHLGATSNTITDSAGKLFVSVVGPSEYVQTEDTARLLRRALRLCEEGFQVREKECSSQPRMFCRGSFVCSLGVVLYWDALAAWHSLTFWRCDP